MQQERGGSAVPSSLAGPVYGEGAGREYYTNVRHELVPFLPGRYSRVLEVGCGGGAFATLLTLPHEYWGVEPNPQAAAQAAARLHRVLADQYDRIEAQLPDRYFDFVVCNDVIEHLADPEAFLTSVRRKLLPGAAILASIPNVRHWEILYEVIVRKDWHYRQSGGLDRTHLRFFTRKSIVRLFEDAGFRIERMGGINASRSAVRRALHRVGAVASLGLFDDVAYPQFALLARLPEGRG